MMAMKAHSRALFESALRAHAAREIAWWKNDHRGRWVVLEPWKVSPKQVHNVALLVERRGRRFSSLARAKAFAREVGGEVRHWRRQMPAREGNVKLKMTWRYEANPWVRVWRHNALWFGGLLGKHEAPP